MRVSHRRISKSIKNPFRISSTKRALYTSLIGLILLGFYWVADKVNEIPIPEEGNPAELYSNQIGDDLRQVFLTGIKDAKQSILLIIYTLTDDRIIQSLRQKAEEGTEVTVVYDAKASPQAAKRLGAKVKVLKRFATGLMHQKILVVDESRTWIGSANMTGESLRFHGNLVTPVHSKQIAAMVWEKARNMRASVAGDPVRHRNFQVGGQDLELWFFPDDPHGVKRLVQLIRGAQKTVRVAMFTWTRKDLADEVIDAQRRGVKTEVVIDRNAGLGAGAEVVKQLRAGGIAVRLSKGNALLHYKFAIIDDETLVNGSANWTKAAFTKNDDCYMILHKLTDQQKDVLKSLWRVIMVESSPVLLNK